MAYKRYFLAIAIALLLAFGRPFSSTAFQATASGGIRVITLSAAGDDIASSVAYSPDGNWLAVGTSAGVAIYDSQTLSQQRFFNTGVWVRSVAFSPDGMTIAAGLFDATARIWSLADGQELQVLSDHEGWVRSVAFSSDGNLLATAADDNTVRLWNAADGTLSLSIPDLTGARVLALSPDGQTIAIGMQDNTIQLRSISDGSLLKSFIGHNGWVRSLAFSPDGTILASGAFDAKAKLWDVASGQLKFTLPDHQSSVLGVSFSPDGQTLATGSVDSTVKLWNVADGSLLRTLVGHSDFVYSVAFAPDGKTIASGSSDNTVRIWDLTDPTAGALPAPATPSDCRLCHHPRGIAAQPRVIQVKCEACHSNGTGMNFCPFFDRAPEATSLPLTYAETGLPVGVPVVGKNLSILINYPTNGEVAYAAAAVYSPLLVTGQVHFTGNMYDVLVQLSAYSADSDEPVVTLETHPSNEGRYTFKLTVNPNGALPASLKPGGANCAECHEDYHSQGDLPNGIVRLSVRAVSPDNETATDERWLRVDTSGASRVDVLVVDQASQQPVVGLPVNADTVLYEWRGRYFRANTDADGLAHINLEALTQAVTTYRISVPDTVLNGYYYSTIEPATITLVAGETSHPTVTIQVKVKTSQIRGQVSGSVPSGQLDIFAIHLPDGQLTKAQSLEGAFEFNELPSGEYLLVPDPTALADLGLQSQPVSVDLTKFPDADVDLAISPRTGNLITGQLHDEDGHLLPFGWITTASNLTFLPDPATGTFTVAESGSANQTVTAIVPGYYTQTQVMNASDEESLTFSMVRQTETDTLSWGNGRIILPSESVYTTDADGIHLTRGWIWGEGDGNDPIVVHVNGMQIELTRGAFALQNLPPVGGWFYLSAGEAMIRTADGLEVAVRGGQMVTLAEGLTPRPVAYDAAVAAFINPAAEPSISSAWEPSLIAQIKNRLAQIGIGFAQAITFVTYLIVLGILVVIVVRGAIWLWRGLGKRE